MGANRVQINLHAGESYTLIAVANSSAGVASDSIALYPEHPVVPAISNIIFHPSAIGYIVYPTVINTYSAIIGDSISNAS